ncbi:MULTISPECIES: phosphopentomutase [Clostridium]|uniref:Phosphopentomutase n=1 Tax=Clostridium novyi (strain NT) TaxID=386415 RepID=DEOB_CLONN|nr:MULTISPECIES: phosphopentomutase [Clostridium]A0PYX6.1 RecName: Full=Phosphopentomutase; AltName: Full=Phosphodeoxyribomutase [Clostridium novyi NT]ABK61687.1 phosphopentomutase [Clostridium novyi NT]KEH86156.1 phosphopentomutase [Clostridium novyi A str. NCTC 538]KEH92712.1 phosphopentomutase [Clostridium botulinum C/D str. It1]KEH94159.1 phosphopentomutase [Clostridium novyi A str. GD211209]
MINRVIWIVLDSVGMGALPDADKYGDVGANTIGNVSKFLGGLKTPNMSKLGLGNIDEIKGIEKVESPIGCYARFKEMSNGKDTTTGHWEMVGINSEQAFPTYPNGFPRDLIEKFEELTGRKVIGNKTASGTEIIKELGEEHVKTGALIVYTSADSVFQIAAHEEVVPLDELYKICEIARNLLTGEHAVARVIARPFEGEVGSFTRTSNRRDFSLVPPYDTVLDNLKKNNLNVMAVGKIEDIFSGKGVTEAVHTKDNMDGVDKTLEYMKEDKKGLIFTNLVDFDMKWGHRNDAEAYGKGIEAFDVRLGEILNEMKDTDVLFITADHGCDPTMPGTDHSREHVPFLAYGKALKENVNLGTRESFADMGQTIAEIFDVEPIRHGKSFLKEIVK